MTIGYLGFSDFIIRTSVFSLEKAAEKVHTIPNAGGSPYKDKQNSSLRKLEMVRNPSSH